DAEEPAAPRSRRARGAKPQAEIPAFASAEERSAWLDERREEAVRKVQRQSNCGYCHEQTGLESPASAWRIVAPDSPERWLPRSHFSHAAHGMLACGECDAAQTSTKTSDVLLPGIDSCR